MFEAKNAFFQQMPAGRLRRSLFSVAGFGPHQGRDSKASMMGSQAVLAADITATAAPRRDDDIYPGPATMMAMLLAAVPTALIGGSLALINGATLQRAFMVYVATGTCTLLAGAGLMAYRAARGQRRPKVLDRAPSQALQDRLFDEVGTRLVAEREVRKAALVLGGGVVQTRRLQSWVQELNHHAITCHDPEIALEMMAVHPDYFEYVLIDTAHLDDAATQEFCQELRSLDPQIPVMFLRAIPAGMRLLNAAGGRNLSVIEMPKKKTELKLAILDALAKRPGEMELTVCEDAVRIASPSPSDAALPRPA